ncbi:hypothetical protein P5408_002930 [Bacillus subtilis]|uniref:hypothetical protein n=2 Tax=Bacillus subtilis group TaxID=653685 RepID=UPI000A11DF14|nr:MULTISPECIES: hypothetical protein [Bacillus subtilis group]MDH3120305.1 hypothetical protein [Bacillus subtilis]AZV48883.1 hypothetical protein DIC78_07475 [Bacillus halotolerans]WEZ00946.1 hypothetical protein P5634_03025 [Bacillus subtilis]WGE04425.1 hypothetical protein P5640_15285 [Bacillus subtilis]WNW25829.1 hypothetical protein RS399_08255 [Bacillus inaquosorum]
MIIMNLSQTHSFMRKAIPLANQMEGDWIARMKVALNSIIIDHYLNLPLTYENVNELLRKGVSYRRICKHYGIGRKDIEKLRQSSIV